MEGSGPRGLGPWLPWGASHGYASCVCRVFGLSLVVSLSEPEPADWPLVCVRLRALVPSGLPGGQMGAFSQA